MLQNLQKFVKFQKFQLDNLVDSEKCCKTHICLQKSVPIQPKTSNILPKFCQPTLSDVGSLTRPPQLRTVSGRCESSRPDVTAEIGKQRTEVQSLLGVRETFLLLDLRMKRGELPPPDGGKDLSGIAEENPKVRPGRGRHSFEKSLAGMVANRVAGARSAEVGTKEANEY